MNYLDYDILKEKVGTGTDGILYSWQILDYVSTTKKFDFHVPIAFYIEIVRLFSSSNIRCERYCEGLPMLEWVGIRFYAISEETADKYRIIK